MEINAASSERKINNPAISIIAPMYNVEKYVGQCLDSILDQTFSNYEMIIVDDCSTDRSVEIVESYIPKFDGRLRLVKLDKNSGGAGIPRNLAIKLSRGEYIANIDSDDMFTKTAMEEFYTIAKETQADVVHAEKHYITRDEVIDLSKPLEVKSKEKVKFVTEPTFETEDLAERIMKYSKDAYWGYPWTKFCRRDFLIENNIEFPAVMTRDDIMYCFQCLVLAKRYVRIPNVVNVYRIREVSHSHTHKDIKFEEYMNKWMSDIIEGVKFMDKFMSKVEFFIKNPKYRYIAIEHFMQEELEWYMVPIYSHRSPISFDLFLKKLFENNSDPALTAYIFSAMNVYRLKLVKCQKQVIALKKQNEALQKKVDELEGNNN